MASLLINHCWQYNGRNKMHNEKAWKLLQTSLLMWLFHDWRDDSCAFITFDPLTVITRWKLCAFGLSGSPAWQCLLSRWKPPVTLQHLLLQRRSHMASVKALRAIHVQPSLLITASPFHSQRPTQRHSCLSCPTPLSPPNPFTPAFHLHHSPHLSLSPSKLDFSAFFFRTCAHPPFSLSLPLSPSPCSVCLFLLFLHTLWLSFQTSFIPGQLQVYIHKLFP